MIPNAPIQLPPEALAAMQTRYTSGQPVTNNLFAKALPVPTTDQEALALVNQAKDAFAADPSLGSKQVNELADALEAYAKKSDSHVARVLLHLLEKNRALDPRFAR